MTIKDTFYSNEQLLKICEYGTPIEINEAEKELLARGNTVTADFKVQRTVKGSALYNEPTIKPDDDVTVVNGKITEVNGQPYP